MWNYNHHPYIPLLQSPVTGRHSAMTLERLPALAGASGAFSAGVKAHKAGDLKGAEDSGFAVA